MGRTDPVMKTAISVFVVLGLAISFDSSAELGPVTDKPDTRTLRFELRREVACESRGTWLLRVPQANPGMSEMFRVLGRQPVPQLVPWAGEFVWRIRNLHYNLGLGQRRDFSANCW
jgi:hypothetical protein